MVYMTHAKKQVLNLRISCVDAGKYVRQNRNYIQLHGHLIDALAAQLREHAVSAVIHGAAAEQTVPEVIGRAAVFASIKEFQGLLHGTGLCIHAIGAAAGCFRMCWRLIGVHLQGYLKG